MPRDCPPFNFVFPTCCEQDLGLVRDLDVDKNWFRFIDGASCWVLQTYLILRSRLEEVRLSTVCSPDAVNLVHATHLRELAVGPDVFIVSLQADYPRCSWAQLHVVQNQSQSHRPDAAWIPHWPQPGLIPRREDRRSVSRVAFAGRGYYLAGQRRQWAEDLLAAGMTFHHMDERCWHDYSEVDILLAIRTFDEQTYDNKPPSKLINAWLAGVPLIAGNDSAFRQIGSPDEDYIVATSFPAALRAIDRLRSDASFYERLVTNGRARGYNRDKIAAAWEDFLTQKAVAKFRQWQKRGLAANAAWRARRFADRISIGLRRRVKQIIRYQAPWARRR